MEKHIVNTPSLFAVDEDFKDERFMRVKIAVMHDNINRNNSSFSLDVIKEAKDSFANIPILAEVVEKTDEDGNTYLDYTTHAMHIEQDAFDENKTRMIYDEVPVGIIPESNDFEIVYDEESGNNYVMVTALLFRDYGNYACDVLKSRNGMTDVSAEIACEDIEYSAKDKCLVVGKMRMCAVTLLGGDVRPGMAKAHATVFAENDTYETKLFKLIEELNESLSIYNNSRKEELKTVDNEKELLEEVTDTVEEISETVEETVEEVVETFEEVTETTEAEVTVKEEFSEDDAEVTPELKFSVNDKNFSVSLSDIQYALHNLVNETYANEETYYGVEVYADDKFVIMIDYMTNRAYKQSFEVNDEVYSLVGERVGVKAVYLTEEEEKSIDAMRSNYAEISDKLAKYEAEPKKLEILNSEDYSQIAEIESFADLKKRENYFDMSVEDLTKKCDEILLAYAKSNKIEFATNSKSNSGIKVLPIAEVATKKPSRYGNTFKS